MSDIFFKRLSNESQREAGSCLGPCEPKVVEFLPPSCPGNYNCRGCIADFVQSIYYCIIQYFAATQRQRAHQNEELQMPDMSVAVHWTRRFEKVGNNLGSTHF